MHGLLILYITLYHKEEPSSYQGLTLGPEFFPPHHFSSEDHERALATADISFSSHQGHSFFPVSSLFPDMMKALSDLSISNPCSSLVTWLHRWPVWVSDNKMSRFWGLETPSKTTDTLQLQVAYPDLLVSPVQVSQCQNLGVQMLMLNQQCKYEDRMKNEATNPQKDRAPNENLLFIQLNKCKLTS